MLLIGGGTVLTFDPSRPFIENGAVAVEGELIRKVGDFSKLNKEFADAEFINAQGGIIMPGFINAHTHFYSGLLRGYALKNYAPASLFEVLSQKSWRLDLELGFGGVQSAAYAGIAECVKNGVTLVFDHHASYGSTSGSLIAIAAAVQKSGIRASLCYETSLRNGYEACCEAMRENEEFISYCSAYPSERIKAMFGLHAPFTLSDFVISNCVRSCSGRTGFHIHVSEGTDDSYSSMRSCGKSPIKRLYDLGILGEKTLLCHCVHITDEEMELLRQTGSFVVNAPQSNMSNAVGTAPALKMLSKGIKVCLGTDSFTYDMFESARAFITAQRLASGKPYAGAEEAGRLLFENNRLLASRYFKKDIGILKKDAPADVIIMDYTPYTRFDESNYMSHILFGMSGRDCTMTMAAGRILMRDRRLISLDEAKLKEEVCRSADEVWKKLDEKPAPDFSSINVF